MFNIAFLSALLLCSCAQHKGANIYEYSQDHSIDKYKIKKKKAEKINDDGIFNANNPDSSDYLRYEYSVGKNYHVGLMVPLTGKFQSIGNQIVDVATLAMFSSGIKNIRLIPLDTKGTEAGAIEAAEKAIKLNVDIVIGPIFSAETKIASEMLRPYDIKLISLSNDVRLADFGTYVFGIPPEALLTASLIFAKQSGKENFGFVLPSTEYGYRANKKISSIANDLGINIMSVDYYPNNKDLIPPVVNKVFNAKKRQYRVRSDGTLYLLDRNSKSSSSENKSDPLVVRKMDGIYIDAKGEMLKHLITEFNDVGAKSEYIDLFSSDMLVETDLQFRSYAKDLYVTGIAAGNFIAIEDRANQILGFKPTKICLLAYDAITLVLYLIKKDGLSEVSLHSRNGYSGIFGDFRFTEPGIVQRKFGMYRIESTAAKMIYKSLAFM